MKEQILIFNFIPNFKLKSINLLFFNLIKIKLNSLDNQDNFYNTHLCSFQEEIDQMKINWSADKMFHYLKLVIILSKICIKIFHCILFNVQFLFTAF